MTHLEYSIMAIKARWVNRLISKSSLWTKLFHLTICRDLILKMKNIQHILVRCLCCKDKVDKGETNKFQLENGI